MMKLKKKIRMVKVLICLLNAKKKLITFYKSTNFYIPINMDWKALLNYV